MAIVEKGIIVTIEDQPRDRQGRRMRAKVQPCTKKEIVTKPLVIPHWLRGPKGNLKKGREVIFCVFDDYTGMIFSRVDGELPDVTNDEELDIDIQNGG